MSSSKTILVAPIDWGLGHATRCIPIIQQLLKEGFDVIPASSGDALLLLRKEFPDLEYLELPTYAIEYPTNGKRFKSYMIRKLKSIYKVMNEENNRISEFVSAKKIDGIISDGRLGVRHPKIPSVFITHQLQVKTGNTTFLSSKLHQFIIKKFNECWVPDYYHKSLNLSGKLGHIHSHPFPIFYIGPLSRMKKKKLPITIDVLAIISGPEPQRTLLEKLLIQELKKSDSKNIVIVRGKIEDQQKWEQNGNLKIVNFALKDELETLINQSDLVISRSGYSTIMDLAHLEKKAFFIPTPGQFEQRYLAGKMDWEGMAPVSSQSRFHLKKLEKAHIYKGLSLLPEKTANLREMFEIFQS